MTKKFLISWAVVFVVWMGGSFLVHGVLLADGYGQLPNLFRTEQESQQYFHLLLAAHIIMAGALVWIYQRGVEARPWLPQGIRFGIAIALLGPISMYTIYFVVQPLPGSFVVQQVVYDSILVIVISVVTAFLNRTATAKDIG